MNTLATTYSGHIRRPKTAKITFTRSGYLKRLRYFIEHSDWDEKFLSQEKKVNNICLVIIILSAIYLVPVLISSLLK